MEQRKGYVPGYIRLTSFILDVLFASVFIGGPFLCRAATPVVQPDIDPVFATHGIQVFPYSSDQFQGMLVGLVGPDNAAACAPLLPYTLILKNGSPTSIAIVVVRYPRVNTLGATIHGMVISRLVDTALPLASGEGLILTPESTLNQALNQLKSPHKFPLSPREAISQASGNIQNTWSGERFPSGQVSLDSVVFADGGVVGPDRMGIVALEQGRLVIENEVMARMQDVSVTDNELVQWLTDLANAPPPDVQSTVTAAGQIELYRKGFAKAMLSRLKFANRADVPVPFKAAQRQRIPPTTALHRLN